MELSFSEEMWDGLNPDELKAQMYRAAELAVCGEGLDPEPVEISVSFVEPEEIRRLNCQYRNKDSVTDVLSFPQFDDWDDLPEEGIVALGDVVICVSQAQAQAEEFGHSLKREILYLFVHSLYHLLGYDHMDEEEKKEMRQKEEAVMTRLGVTRKGEETKEYTPRSVKEDQKLALKLYQTAKEAAKNAFAPFSGFRVGAALLSCDGRIFTGVNVESSSYGATICAERTALVKAVSEGVRDFAALAVTAQSQEAWPCGICRQMLYEFSPELFVITGKDEKHLMKAKLSELLPFGFRLDKNE